MLWGLALSGASGCAEESRREEGCAPALSGGEGFEDALPDGQAVAGEVEAGAAASEDFEVDEGDEDPGERLGLGASAAAASSWRDIAGDGAAQAAAVLGTMAADDDEDRVLPQRHRDRLCEGGSDSRGLSR